MPIIFLFLLMLSFPAVGLTQVDPQLVELAKKEGELVAYTKSEGRWKFTRWDLVDLAHFKVKLKAEFQGSNHDLYRPEAIVATSAK